MFSIMPGPAVIKIPNRAHGSDVNDQFESTAIHRKATNFVLWTVIALYAFARILQAYPGRIPMVAVIALHVFPPAIFALIHGAKYYGWGGLLRFVTITLVTGKAGSRIE
jgi:hypothetical protein